MKLDYDSLPTLMLVAAGLFVMFASPPIVNYEGVESAGRNMPFDGEENPNYGKAYVLESNDYVEKALALTEAYSNLDKEKFSSLAHERMLPFADQMDDQESYSWKPWAMVPLSEWLVMMELLLFHGHMTNLFKKMVQKLQVITLMF